MPPACKPDRIVEALRAGDLAAFREGLRANPRAARSPRLAVGAAQRALKPALVELHRAGAEWNAAYRGYRPLHALIQEDAHEATKATPAGIACLKWLLAHGADPELTGAWPPARAILVAAFTGEPAYVEALREGGAKIDGFVGAALGDRKLVEQQLKKDPEFARARDKGALTALQCAAASRMGAKNSRTKDKLLEVVALLLDHGAEVNARTKSWSHDVDAAGLAVGSGQPEMVALLLDRGADPEPVLCAAAWRKQFDLAELALRHGATFDRAVDEGKPLLNQLIRWGQVDSVLWMLKLGASPNIADDRGWTALHQAASRGNERMLRAALAAGGDTRKKDRSGFSPLDIARVMGRRKLFPLLGDLPPAAS